jgi:integrase
MRQGEILNLRWVDVDLVQGRITLHETKNGERRSVPLVGRALALLTGLHELRRADTDFVFPNSHLAKPLLITKAWNTAVAKAGIEDFRFHDLRHSAASYLVMNGASLAEVGAVLGHKTVQMTKRYTHLADGHTKRAVEAMNKKIFAEAAEC